LAVTTASLIALDASLDEVEDAILQDAIDSIPLFAKLDRFPTQHQDRLGRWVALHILALQGFGDEASDAIQSQSAGGVSVSYAVGKGVDESSSSLSSTRWGRLFLAAARGLGLRMGVT
jgi:hypothetical protein